MNKVAFCLTLSAQLYGANCFSQAVATTVELRIAVEKQPYGQSSPQPFAGIGVFDLFRGGTKMQGAACPDKSSQSGEVKCRIPCSKGSKETMVVRVRPPSDQDALAGWVTPAHRDVSLQGCTIQPTNVTMRYEDARFALNELFQSQYFASTAPANSSAASLWVAAASAPAFAAKVSEAASTADGRAAVADFYRYASLAASAPDFTSGKLPPDEQKQYEAIVQWQIATKNAMLASKLKSTLPTSKYSGVKLQASSDLAAYRENLIAADRLLANLPSKTPEQFKLLDDVKTLKSLPATGKDAASASEILEGWR